MAKSAESARRTLRRSRNVSSFFEESTENAMSPKTTTVNVVVDVHNVGERSDRRQQQQQQRDSERENDLTNNKETKRSWRANNAPQNRSSNASKDLAKHDDLMVESLDLIEEFEAPKRGNESLEEKPRRRKQWNTVTANEAEVDLGKRPPRKRWSKDAGVIRLPETSDDSRKTPAPVPAPRTSLRRSGDARLLFDNPAFVSDNEDEVLRVEMTDHNRDTTKIEMRRLSDRSSRREDLDEAGITSSGSSRKHRRREMASSEALAVDSDRSSKARSSASRRNSSVGQPDSSASSERIILDQPRSSSIASEERVSSSHRSKLETRDHQSSRRRERSLLKKREPSGDDAAIELVSSSARVRRKRKKKRRQEKEATKEEVKFISVTIHRADVLEADYVSVRRPMVRVHIVEARTGSYLKSAKENGGAYLQPMITGKFDFKKNRSMIPIWEEELVFEHNFDAIMRREEGEVVILFEVIELLSFADASLNYDKIGNEGCWNKIAWAFLKPVGINNIFHTDKKVRLQLYKPRQSFKKYGKQKCEVYTWWQSNNRDKYPSSLLVTITSVPPPKIEPVLYQKLPINDLLNDERNDSRGLSTKTTSESIGLPKWARLAAQSCKIPNEKMFETEVNEKGCFYIAFSNDGKYLACVHSEEYDYPIVVYEVETGKIHVRFLGHKTFVYSLNWSSDDHCLLSASADQTALIWDVRNQIVQHIEMLPHPSYVYCAKYGPGNAMIVATGCYDQIVRIWANDRRSRKRELNQELEGHEGFVNCIVFQKTGNLITADSVGLIIAWTIHKDSRTPSKRIGCISRKIKLREIEGVIINTIVLHPLESRLLVHSRDNGLRMVDLATGVVLQKYKRLNNQKIQLKACISPCGGFVICGSEDSVLNIWNLETGKHVAKYTNDGHGSAKMIVACVDYHPYDHVLAYSIFGSSTSVRILRYNKNANGSDVGLHLMEDPSQIRGNEVILNASNYLPSRQRKPRDDTAERKQIPSLSRHPTVDHTLIQIENNDYERPWTMPHHSREMERNWRKKSWDRLHCIIEKIDSILFGNSMFLDDVAEAKRSSSANERCGSWINASNNVALQRDDMPLEDCAANSTRSHNSSLGNSNNTQSSFQAFKITSESPNHSFHVHNSAAPFKKTNTSESSHINSPDSTGTYIVEMSNFNKNVEVAIVAEEMDSIPVVESDSSRTSNVTFLIENEHK